MGPMDWGFGVCRRIPSRDQRSCQKQAHSPNQILCASGKKQSNNAYERGFVARIAVVDDSKLIRVFAEAALQKAGHEVITIEPNSLQSTLEALLEGKPDLLLLDHSMPAFQGPSLVRACFENPELSRVKVIILTALHDEEMVDRMKKLGVDCVLHKPIQHEDLTKAVTRLLGDAPEN